MMLVDSHCHLDFPDYAGRMEEIRERMMEHRVSHALCVCVNVDDFPKVLALAARYDNFFASAGVHPDHVPGEEVGQNELVRLADHPRVVAIGETGLDYYRLKGDLEWQRERFRRHIRAARQTGKPLIIHTRSAAADTLRIMKEEGAEEVGGVMHCFTESLEVARAAIELGFHISFSGIVTFKSAADLREVAKTVPANRLLVETDSPYLAPTPFRGKTNQPAWVRHVAVEIARLRNVTIDTIEKQTTENFFNLFKIVSR